MPTVYKSFAEQEMETAFVPGDGESSFVHDGLHPAFPRYGGNDPFSDQSSATFAPNQNGTPFAIIAGGSPWAKTDKSAFASKEGTGPFAKTDPTALFPKNKKPGFK
jgi:hypothetical protein